MLLAAALMAGSLPARAQQLSNRGRDFWVGYGHHQYMEPGQNNSQEMVLYLSAEQAANVTVTIKGASTTSVLNYSIPANSTITTAAIPKQGSTDARLVSPPVAFGGNGGEGIFARSIRIQSDVPIVAYAHIYATVSSGATLLLPSDAWSYSYTSMNSEQVNAGGPAFSWLYVVAKEDSTVVQIMPSVATRLGKPAGQTFTVTLNKGEIYQLLGQADASGNGGQLTGSTVRSVTNSLGARHPIAVFSGSSRTQGETACGATSGRDNDIQQSLPANAWGTRYLTAPFSAATASTLLPASSQTSVYKIVPRWPNTTVRRNGTILTPTSPTGWYSFTSNQPELIESDQPVMVGQFMSGGSACNAGSVGDPEMIFLTPLDQGIRSARFFRNNSQAIAANYVTVILPAAGLASLRIDGSAALDHSYDHPRLPGYKVAIKGWTAAQASVQIQSDSAFTALTYGLGSAESYGYNVGMLVRNLDAQSALRTATGTVTTNTTVRAGEAFRFALQSPLRLGSITWRASAVPGLSPVTDNTVSNPVPADSVIINGRTWYTFLSDSSYTPSLTGNYTVPVGYAHPLLEGTQSDTLAFPLTVIAGVATALNDLRPVDPAAFDAANLSLSPNPARTEVRIRFTGRHSGQLSATLISKVGAATGRSISFTGNTATLDVGGLASGTYILVLRDARTGRSVQRQLIKL
ncbi:T9SS type A sorting domain-containing protein [Flaviaesturariibacter amylovorans]|uniref:IgGFc-binding protein N-terminal domain-containing protein n=1 Tax=Flaviaesturariibacter amylovorans TaxID=1084520 RepID=A0ABP8GJZ1_9BACT